MMSGKPETQQVNTKCVAAADRQEAAAIGELSIPSGRVAVFCTNEGKEGWIGDAGIRTSLCPGARVRC